MISENLRSLADRDAPLSERSVSSGSGRYSKNSNDSEDSCIARIRNLTNERKAKIKLEDDLKRIQIREHMKPGSEEWISERMNLFHKDKDKAI